MLTRFLGLQYPNVVPLQAIVGQGTAASVPTEGAPSSGGAQPTVAISAEGETLGWPAGSAGDPMGAANQAV